MDATAGIPSVVRPIEHLEKKNSNSRLRIVAGALGVGALIAAASFLYGGHSAGDDTYIYMRYAGNVLAGNGFTFNPGEPSFGVTSPLWTFVMIPIAYIFGNTIVVWKIASVLLLGMAASVLSLFLSRFAIGTAGLAAVTVLGILEPQTFRWGSSGMENSLALFLLVSSCATFYILFESEDKGMAFAAGVTLGLLPFARPEFLVLAFTLCGYLLYRAYVESGVGRRRDATVLLTASAVMLVTILAMALLTRAAFGALVPQSAAAKALFLRFEFGRYYGISQSLKIAFGGSLGGFLLWFSVRKYARQLKPLFVAAGATVAASILYLGYQNQLVSTRYGTEMSAPLLLAAAIGLAGMVYAEGKWRRLNVLLFGVQSLVFLAVLWFLFPATRTNEGQDIREIVNLLKAHRPAGTKARVALSDVGAFGFYSDDYIIDLVGLTDKATLAWGRQNGAPHYDVRALEKLLIDRKAEYYVDTRAGGLIQGQQLNFVPVGEGIVRRSNYSYGAIIPDVWRIYELEPGKY